MKIRIVALLMLFLLSLPFDGICNTERAERVSAIVVDTSTGHILFQQEASRARYPASLTKLMTLYLMFEALEDGGVSFSDRIKFSHRAAAQPSMKLGVKAGQRITVEEAVLALIVLSANDVAVAVGEWLGAGSEGNFVGIMNKKARALRMHDTVFRNASGLHHPDQVTTARDVAKLAISLRMHFPQYYKYFSHDQFNFRNQRIYGHNMMVSKYKEVDGLKTGYVSASGYNLATSITKDDFSIVSVLLGGKTSSSRDALMDFLINTVTTQKTGGSLTIVRPTTNDRQQKSNSAKRKVAKPTVVKKQTATIGAKKI